MDEYFANQLWNYSSDFINRALYVGDTVYTLGESGVKSWSLISPSVPLYSLKYKVEPPSNVYGKPIMLGDTATTAGPPTTSSIPP